MKWFGYVGILCIAVALFAAGCQGGRINGGDHGAGPGNGTVEVAGIQEAMAGLPFPDPRDGGPEEGSHATSWIQDQQKNGEDYLWHSANATKNGNHAVLSPGPGEASWAIYRFGGIADEDSPQSINVEFAAPLPETWYLGVADYSSGNWYWRTGGSLHGTSSSESETITLPGPSDFTTDGGYLYAAVLTWDSAAATVYSATLATDVNDLAPVALVNADPYRGNATLAVNFDASTSYDRDGGGITEYRWDYDNDGTVDHTSATPDASHNYGTRGEYTLRLEVVDGDGLSDFASRSIYVQGWIHTWGNGDLDSINDMVVDAEGNVIAVGGTVNTTSGVADLLVAKYNRYGEPLWYKTHGGTLSEAATGVARLADGNLLVGGYTLNHGQGGYDLLLLCIDSDGGTVWAKTWGDAESERINDMQVDSAGNIYVTGYTFSFGAQKQDLLTARFQPDGAPDWARIWGMAELEEGHSIAIDSIGNSYVAGHTTSPNPPSSDSLLIKFGPAGDTMFPIILSTAHNEGFNAISLDFIGNIYVAGDVWTGNIPLRVAKFNSDGVFQWSKTWDSGDRATANDLVVTGSMFAPVTLHLVGISNNATSDKDILWMTMSAAGVVDQAKCLIAPGVQDCSSISAGPYGSYLLSGWAQDTSGVWLDTPGTASAESPTVGVPIVTGTTVTGVSAAQDISLTDAVGTEDTGGGGVYDGLAMCFYEDDL